MYEVQNESFYSVTEQLKVGYAFSCLWQKTKPLNEKMKPFQGFFMIEQLKYLIIPQYMRSSGRLIEVDQKRSTTPY